MTSDFKGLNERAVRHDVDAVHRARIRRHARRVRGRDAARRVRVDVRRDGRPGGGSADRRSTTRCSTRLEDEHRSGPDRPRRRRRARAALLPAVLLPDDARRRVRLHEGVLRRHRPRRDAVPHLPAGASRGSTPPTSRCPCCDDCSTTARTSSPSRPKAAYPNIMALIEVPPAVPPRGRDLARRWSTSTSRSPRSSRSRSAAPTTARTSGPCSHRCTH